MRVLAEPVAHFSKGEKGAGSLLSGENRLFGGRAAKLQPHVGRVPGGPVLNGSSVATSAHRESASQPVVRGCCEQTLVELVTHAKRRVTWIDPAGIMD